MRKFWKKATNNKGSKDMAICGQCGKPAVASVGDNPLCVDCHLKFEQAMEIQSARCIREMNYLIGSIESVAGVPSGVLARYPEPQPVIHQGPLTFHNIKVDRSVVGSINTGEVQRIDVAMSHIMSSGDEELAGALKEFTEAVLAASELDADSKNELVEQISFLASQSILPKEKQKRGIIKTVLLGVTTTVTMSASLLTIWDKLQPILEKVLSH